MTLDERLKAAKAKLKIKEETAGKIKELEDTRAKLAKFSKKKK